MMKEKLWFVFIVYSMAVLFSCSTVHVNLGDGRAGDEASIEAEANIGIANEL